MTLFSRYTALLVVAALLAACNPTPNIRIAGDQPLKHLTIEDERGGVRSSEGDMAWIGADGSLLIDGQPVVLDAPQRALTVRYYTEAHAMQLCARIGTLQSVQDELAQAVPAFTPFATISNTRTEACTQDVADDSSDALTGDAVASPNQN